MSEKVKLLSTFRHDFLTAVVTGDRPAHGDLEKARAILDLLAAYPEAFVRHRSAVDRRESEDVLAAGILADAMRLGRWTQGEVEQCFFTKPVLAALESARGIPMDDRRYSPAPL